MHALWLLVSQRGIDRRRLHRSCWQAPMRPTRNWGVRIAGQAGKIAAADIRQAGHPGERPVAGRAGADAVAAGRLVEPDPLPLLLALLDNPENAKDPLIPTIIYNNLKPLAPKRGKEILAYFEKNPKADAAFGETIGRWIGRSINLGGARAERGRRRPAQGAGVQPRPQEGGRRAASRHRRAGNSAAGGPRPVDRQEDRDAVAPTGVEGRAGANPRANGRALVARRQSGRRARERSSPTPRPNRPSGRPCSRRWPSSG